ncbi:hypothetical protein [Halegenticoccus tardaugens]|uniref:hypothetical protein n=1 Tax=Halegenticoccus tardaugens TaxID=2071624 RepID=UPI00100B93A1|nr:hypothetical protein [Halegenticoccus tardaugens]
MSLRVDSRAVTVQIGAILLFGMLVVSMSAYQASVVPAENREAEFEHSWEVRADMLDLRGAILRAASDGGSRPVTVELGTRYPSRTLFVNPPPSGGTLRTEGNRTAILSNASADGETGDYWTGEPRSFPSTALTYAPSYTEYRDAPTTVYEHGTLYDRFDGGETVGSTGQTLVDGKRISLVSVDGSVSASSAEPTAVDPRGVSAPARTVTVGNRTENLTLAVRTGLSASAWEDALADQFVEAGGRVVAVRGGESGAVEIVLEPGEYDLRLARVGVGGHADAEPRYLTDVRGDDETVRGGSTELLVVEVRDRYNTPVSGETVNLSLVDDGVSARLEADGKVGEEIENAITDAEGRVEVTYRVDDFDGEPEPVRVRAATDRRPSTDPGGVVRRERSERRRLRPDRGRWRGRRGRPRRPR